MLHLSLFLLFVLRESTMKDATVRGKVFQTERETFNSSKVHMMSNLKRTSKVTFRIM